MIGVSGAASARGVGASSPQPEAALVAVTASAAVDTARTRGTTSRRTGFRFALTRPR